VEQGMIRDYLLSADALIALSGLRSALDILEDHRSTRRPSPLLWQQTPARISKLLAVHPGRRRLLRLLIHGWRGDIEPTIFLQIHTDSSARWANSYAMWLGLRTG
jgi:hypothetical protein